jgi:hypothetical protein
MMRAAAPFSFFSFRRQQTKREKKYNPEQVYPRVQTSKPPLPHPPTQSARDKTLMGKYKTGW